LNKHGVAPFAFFVFVSCFASSPHLTLKRPTRSTIEIHRLFCVRHSLIPALNAYFLGAGALRPF
jgi:hypothetical protein